MDRRTQGEPELVVGCPRHGIVIVAHPIMNSSLSARTAEPLSAPCDLCACSLGYRIGSQHVRDVRTSSGTVDFDVSISCCVRCGLVFQDPMQDEGRLNQYYATMFREERYRPAAWKAEEFKERHLFGSRFLDGLPEPTVMEVGCADGTTLSGFRELGLAPFGIELSATNAAACRARGLDVFEGPYEAYAPGERLFGLVTSYYVMEHLRSPRRFLTFCNESLHQGGVLLLEIPDIGAYASEESAVELLFFFEHQAHFTRATVERMLASCGFELIEFGTATHAFGMHLAARKVGTPLPLGEIECDPGSAAEVLAELARYQAVSAAQLGSQQERIATVFGNGQPKKVVLFGAGGGARLILRMPDMPRARLAFISDNNPDKWGTEFEGILVRPPTEIDSTVDLVVIASSFHREIRAQLLEMGIDDQRIAVL